MADLLTLEQLFAERGGEQRVRDRLSRVPEVADQDRLVGLQITSASDEAIGYLRARYGDRATLLTAATAPPVVRSKVADLAWSLLLKAVHDTRAEEVDVDRDRAVAWFRAVARGEVTIDLPDASEGDQVAVEIRANRGDGGFVFRPEEMFE